MDYIPVRATRKRGGPAIRLKTVAAAIRDAGATALIEGLHVVLIAGLFARLAGFFEPVVAGLRRPRGGGRAVAMPEVIHIGSGTGGENAGENREKEGPEH